MLCEAPLGLCQCPEALTALTLTLGSAKCYVKHHWASVNAQMCQYQRSWALTVSQGCFTYHSESPTANVNTDSGLEMLHIPLRFF